MCDAQVSRTLELTRAKKKAEEALHEATCALDKEKVALRRLLQCVLQCVLQCALQRVS